LNLTDTAFLSDRIDAKLNKSDTSLLNLTSRLATKLNVTDTAFLSNRIDNKLNKTDTSLLNLTNRFSTKLNKEDFPSGSNDNEILYWNGSKWVTLAPGTTGQSIIMSSTGLSWGCIITNIAAAPSSYPNLLVNTALTNITIATTGATGIDTTNSGLPAGVTASWLANVITISGTPTAVGTFNYTFSLTGGCGSVNATGTITVTAAPSFTCGTSTIADYNNINTYTTVSIGNQCWMAENLRTRLYNDGTEIRFDNSGGADGSGSGQTWGALTSGAHTLYRHDSTASPSNLTSYGYLYNWYAAKGIATAGSTTYKNICPTGWHVPTDSDWNKLIRSIDSGADTTGTSTQSSTAGTLKKSDALWETNTGTNTSGFSALPGGVRYSDGSFSSISYSAFFWSATEFDDNNAWFRNVGYYGSLVLRTSNYKSVGASVRCLKD
jgi:uncharacterized protein (TIGR02145 family)